MLLFSAWMENVNHINIILMMKLRIFIFLKKSENC